MTVSGREVGKCAPSSKNPYRPTLPTSFVCKPKLVRPRSTQAREVSAVSGGYCCGNIAQKHVTRASCSEPIGSQSARPLTVESHPISLL